MEDGLRDVLKRSGDLTNRVFEAFSIAHQKEFKKVFYFTFALFEFREKSLFFSDGGKDIIQRLSFIFGQCTHFSSFSSCEIR